MGFVDMDYDIISYSDQMPLAQHYSYFIIYSPSKSRFHVIPYKDDEYLNRSTKAVTNKPRIFSRCV